MLKGPNAVLCGETDRAVANAVSKRPTFEPQRSGFVTAGPFDTAPGGFDVGGPLAEGTVAWRLTGSQPRRRYRPR